MNDQQTPSTPPRLSYRGHRIVAALRGRGWQQARLLAPQLGLSTRELRSEAAASGGRVIAGQRGYCLIEEAGQIEIEKSAAWLISQGEKMIARGEEIRRRAEQQEAAR